MPLKSASGTVIPIPAALAPHVAKFVNVPYSAKNKQTGAGLPAARCS
jgi:hypothetical protein